MGRAGHHEEAVALYAELIPDLTTTLGDVISAAYEAGAAPLVVLAVVASAIAAFFYVRVIVLMYFTDPKGEDVEVVLPSAFSTVALAASVIMTVVLGVVPV